MKHKFRIKIVVDGNNSTIYYPQYKGLFFWKYFNDPICYNIPIRLKCYSLSSAKTAIDLRIYENKTKQINSVKYVYYP